MTHRPASRRTDARSLEAVTGEPALSFKGKLKRIALVIVVTYLVLSAWSGFGGFLLTGSPVAAVVAAVSTAILIAMVVVARRMRKAK